MICARGKIKPRILRLTLRCGGGKSLWAPLVLRWRRRARVREVRPERRTSRVQQRFLTQNHFYFSTHTSVPDRRYSQFEIFPTATIHRERIAFDRGWTTNVMIQRSSRNARDRRSLSPAPSAAVSTHRERLMFDRTQTNVVTINRISEPRRVYHHSYTSYSTQRALPGFIFKRTESLTRFQSAYPSTSRFRRSPRGSSVVRALPVPRVNTRRERFTHVSQTQSHTRESRDYRSLVLSMRAAVPTPTTPTSAPKKSTRIYLDSPEELVWRRQQSPVTNTEVYDHAKTLTPAQSEGVTAGVDEAPTQTVSPSIARSTPQQVTKLDPALVDRLTDDVIRRIEKRARIERQRRGL